MWILEWISLFILIFYAKCVLQILGPGDNLIVVRITVFESLGCLLLG